MIFSDGLLKRLLVLLPFLAALLIAACSSEANSPPKPEARAYTPAAAADATTSPSPSPLANRRGSTSPIIRGSYAGGIWATSKDGPAKSLLVRNGAVLADGRTIRLLSTPRWSADERHIAFEAVASTSIPNYSGEDAELYVADKNGSNIRQ